jgi:TolB-like protein/DNA-binding winged helix-turn-helix (wHTH) protein/tetratricopeptide (TPR) repeat protein
MEKQTFSSRFIEIGSLRLDPRTGELSGNGKSSQLSVQPLQALLILLERPGELITRDELVRRVWSGGTFVDYDHSLNKVVDKLRDALGDSAEQPTYIETLPRRGYRMIASVVVPDNSDDSANSSIPPALIGSGQESPPKADALADQPVKSDRKWGRRALVAASAFLLLASAIVGLNTENIRRWVLQARRPAKAEFTSLAVLPLENLSGNAEQAYFADGMTDALITEIAKIQPARVISRTSVMRFKGTRKPVQQIGRELNVDAIVEGTVLQSDQRVRITAQLILVSSDMHIWADSFEGNTSEILSVQQEVASNIARKIGTVVRTVERPDTVNPEAYGEYLKGRYHFLQYTADDWQQAIEHFTRAIEADPNFAPAHAGLAQSYLVAAGWNTFPPDEALRQGEAAARKALALDGSLASSHLAMAVALDRLYDRKNAEKEFARGLELNPNDSLAWQQHGNHLLSDGRFAEAIAEQKHAIQLDPLSHMMKANLARAFYYAREYDEAIAQAQSALKLEPNYTSAFRWIEPSYRHKGMLEEAYRAQLAACSPEDRPQIEAAHRHSGYKGALLFEARRFYQTESLVESSRDYAQADDPLNALALLEETAKRGWPGLERLKVDPDFDPLRADPRFARLTKQAGFE